MHDSESGSAAKSGPGIPFAGLLLVAVGVLFLLDSLNVVSATHLVTQGWPVILILVGLERGFKSPGARQAAFVLIALGAVLLLFTLGVLPWDLAGRWWPLLIIAVGLWVMVRGRR